VTGPSKGGIGAETAISLAHGAPAMLILLGRSLERVQPTIDAIKEVNPNVPVKFFEVDLASLKSVRRAAQVILADGDIPGIDVTVNNAAVMACPQQATEDGFEYQLAANHLGHFVLTNTIMPKIKAAAAAAGNKNGGGSGRIVVVSSSGHRYNPFRVFDPNYAQAGSYSEFGAYGSSKSAMLLYAVALNRRLAASRGVYAYGVHPGSIATNLQGHMQNMSADALGVLEDGCWRIMGMGMAKFRTRVPRKSLQGGCATTLRAALDPSLPQAEGVYLEDTVLTTDTRLAKEWATDPELAEQCWKVSEELACEKFEI
jgi:NAD(P)-dependent dehydrogenase (short-subunit alcohol dehydrogenase family)